MLASQEYYFNMCRSFTQGLAAVLVLVACALAQGPPASVTSSGFGGNGNRGGGPPASVTSPGFGNTGQNRFFFTAPTNHQFPGNRNHDGQRRHDFFPRNNNLGGAVYAVPVPYYVPADTIELVDDTMEQMPAQPGQYMGGPTMFDRRGPGVVASVERAPEREPVEEASVTPPSNPAPAAEQPQTLLIFKDGHKVEVQNYAILGDMLYDMTPGHSRKVLLADLDIPATTKQNDDRGIDFRLPPHKEK